MLFVEEGGHVGCLADPRVILAAGDAQGLGHDLLVFNTLLDHGFGRQHQVNAVQVETVLAQGFILHLGVPLQLAVGGLDLQQVVEFRQEEDIDIRDARDAKSAPTGMVIKQVGALQTALHVMQRYHDFVVQAQRPCRGGNSPPLTDKQLFAHQRRQAADGLADGRGGHLHHLGGGGDAPIADHSIQDAKEIQINVGHDGYR